jgi:hypothetical protein
LERVWWHLNGGCHGPRHDRASTQDFADEIHARLSEAAGIAKAAEACALAGTAAQGVAISMEIEQLIYEAGRLQDAASLLNRLSRQ